MIIFNTQDPHRQALQALSGWAIRYEMAANRFDVTVTEQDDSVHSYSFSSTGTLEQVSEGIIMLNPNAKLIELKGGHIIHDENGDQVF